MGEIVVKHFRRSSVSSSEKELITEVVVESSDTGRFLRRMEDSRLSRPCFQTIDMRGRVAGECRPYAFNDRIHYLDDISFKMFEDGLREYNGVYTVGTFEAIVGGPHTLQAQESARELAERRREEIEQRRLERARQAALERARVNAQEQEPGERDVDATPVENPPQLPLGYFRKRVYPRLQYACAVSVSHGNIKSRGMTRDLSICGAQVRIRGLTTFRQGQEVQVNFEGLREQAGKVNVSRIPYHIVALEERDAETVLYLKRLSPEKQPAFSTLVEELVERYRHKYKLDIDDEYQSVLSWYYERCYAQSATQIPFYIEKDDEGELRIQAVAMSEGNAHLARFFCTDADNYNFTPLCLAHRLAYLEREGSFVMAIYRQRGDNDQCMRLHSAADFEFDDPELFQAFVQYAIDQGDYSVVKVHVSRIPALTVSARKLDEVSERLQYKSEAQMNELRERIRRLRIVAYVADITRMYREAAPRAGTPDDAALAAWVGTERRATRDGSVRDRVEMAAASLRPELVRFGYVERRREDRYLAETRVDVKVGNSNFQGMSKDISTRGIRVHLEQDLDVQLGDRVSVGLVSLQKKKTATNLSNIPYKVVKIIREAGTTLMLERVLGGNQEGLKEFFVELIAKNQHKLGVDVGDIWGATASRVYEALLAANTPTVPLFIGRNQEGGAHLQFVGVPEAGNFLVDFFNGNGERDFRCLNERRIVLALYDAVQILLRQSRNAGGQLAPFELDLYLYKEYDEVLGASFVHAATEMDFSTDASREAFLSKLSEYPSWRYLKVVATFAQTLDEKILDRMISGIRDQSKHRAIKLSDLFHSLAGYGEIIDITDQWSTLHAPAAD
jgi:c-di-GMP-binding flagellar brake protein YcgR